MAKTIRLVVVNPGFCCICSGCKRVIADFRRPGEPRYADINAGVGTYYCSECAVALKGNQNVLLEGKAAGILDSYQSQVSGGRKTNSSQESAVSRHCSYRWRGRGKQY